MVRASGMSLLFLAACNAPIVGGGTPSTTTPSAGPVLTPVESLPYHWTPAVGYSIISPTIVGDVNGDGLADAVTEATVTSGVAPIPPSDALVILGPLARSLTLPGDEDARVVGGSLQPFVGDATGDGIDDLVVEVSDAPRLFAGGALSGDLDVDSALAVPWALFADMNGDGILDMMAAVDNTAATFQFTYGPASRWSGAADATVAIDCAAATDSTSFFYEVGPSIVPDVDGDGIPELYFDGGYTYAPSCERMVFPVPAPGTTRLEPGVDGHYNIGPFEVVPDQTGDGLRDVYLSRARQIVPAPVTFVDGSSTDIWAPGTVTGTGTFTVDPAVGLGAALPFDLTGDGIDDWIGTNLDGEDSSFVVPGGLSLESITWSEGWTSEVGARLGVGSPFVENGRGMAFASRSGMTDFAILDLGPLAAP